MNRKALALSLAALAVTGVTVNSLSTPTASATVAPKHRCVLHISLFEDQSFSGNKVILDGKKLTDHWRVNDYRIYGTITADQYGRVGYNTDSSMTVNGIQCGFAIDRG